jgi:flagellar biosynthesis protein FliQ
VESFNWFAGAQLRLKIFYPINPMTPESVLNLARDAFYLLILVSAPMLIVVLAIGLIVSLFQAATQINEMTLSFIPKLIGLIVTLMIAGPWMVSVITDYIRQLLTSIPTLVG